MSLNNIWVGSDKVNSIEMTANGVDKTVQDTSFEIPPTFADSTWAKIKQVCQDGLASCYFNIGDEKTITDTNNVSWTIRIIDLQAGRYKYTSTGNPTHAVFEFTQQNSATNNGWDGTWNTGGSMCKYSSSKVHLQAEGDVLMQFTDLTSILEDVDIYCMNGLNTTATEQVSCKLFAPAYAELFASESATKYKNERKSTYDSSQMASFDYYITHTTNTAWVKLFRDPSTLRPVQRDTYYTLRTPYKVDGVTTSKVGAVRVNWLWSDVYAAGQSYIEYNQSVNTAFCFAL